MKTGLLSKRISLIAVWFWAVSAQFGVAQGSANNTRKDHHRYWASAGFGSVWSQVQPAGQPNVTTQLDVKPDDKMARYFGFMATASFQPKKKRRVLTARYNVNAELFHQHMPGIKVGEMGALYGLRFNNFIVSTGLSRVWGVDRGSFLHSAGPHDLFSGNRYEKVTYSTVGIPLEARFVIPFEWVTFGLTAFGNFNKGHSYGGFNLSVCVGRFH